MFPNNLAYPGRETIGIHDGNIHAKATDARIRDADVICKQPSGDRLLALVNVFPIRSEDDEVVGAENLFRHNTSKTVAGLGV